MIKKILAISFVFLFLLTFVSAEKVTGQIGNSRMILRAEPGEKVERYILVKNVNNLPMTIKLSPAGDLEDKIKIQDKEFVLEPGAEKRARFTISSKEEGSTETKIGVCFVPEEGNGVCLSSTVILIISGDSNQDDNSQDDQDDSDTGFSFNPSGHAINTNSQQTKISTTTLFLISSGILAIILIALIVYSTKKKTKKTVKERRA